MPVIAAAAASVLMMTVLTAAQHFGACLVLSAKTPARSISEVMHLLLTISYVAYFCAMLKQSCIPVR